MTGIETGRLLLRDWKVGDLDPYARMCADPAVMRWIGSGQTKTPDQCAEAIRQFEDHWSRLGFGLFAVEVKGNRNFIGFAGLATPEFLPEVLPAVEIGWRLARNAWGRGYGTEAARACMEFGFKDVGLAEIVSIHQIGNDASERIMKKIGMQFDRRTIDPSCDRAVNVYRKSRPTHYCREQRTA